MKSKTLSFQLSIFESLAELPKEDQELISLASQAKENAYAPYSHFKVGAAVLLENKQVVIGSNQENASYPSGLCAERVAVFQAGAKFPGVTILKIAIVASSEKTATREPAAPCGNCRQSIFEYENKQKKPIELLLMGGEGPIYKCLSIKDILPLAFKSDFLV
ncbi:cytidine deaminase [uncultured Muriicola sp.]|uniref:cytidine deaminase n=1 Tax=uncultured Muriicola sp. TaxID=1583102 RepID=UPI0026368ACD|nr:cytidine deaminase [uncultured Muriicola sp.]